MWALYRYSTCFWYRCRFGTGGRVLGWNKDVAWNRTEEFPALPQLPCSCAQMSNNSHESWTSLRYPPDAPPFPADQLARGQKAFPARDLWFYEGEEGGKQAAPLPLQWARNQPLRGCGGAGFISSCFPEARAGRAEPGWAGGSVRIPRSCDTKPSSATYWLQRAQEPEQRSPTPLSFSSRISCLSFSSRISSLPSIHHRLPLSLRRRGCHPAEKNELFKRGTVGEHETN